MQRSVRARFAVVLTVLALAFTAVLTAVPAGAAPRAGTAATAVGPLGYDPADTGSLSSITRIVGAQQLWAAGFTGRGIDVAVVDTGVTRVAGLDQGQVIDGPDFSFDSQNPDLRNLDSYGHGTHMAGIIAGRDPGASLTDPNRFVGVAPEARIVNLKVGATDGATDVTQVIAAINWAVEHRNTDGLNIRVLNLSFGTDAIQPALIDPLAYAVDQAWRAGIVVVVAAGNDGIATPQLANPATNPLILAVGASDPMGTIDGRDDTVPAFASHGNVLRPVDVVAPGTHVLSLRVPGSYVDLNNPGGVVGTRFIRGSGTSQAAAVTSGLAALLVQKFPTATPDQIKALLMSTARPIGTPGVVGSLTNGLRLPIVGNPVNSYWAGRGVVNGAPAVTTRSLPRSAQLAVPATGLGSLDAARGTARVAFDGIELLGEIDIFGLGVTTGPLANRWTDAAWESVTFTANRWTDATWTGMTWDGSRWTGNRWTASRWTGNRWTGNRWSAGSWS
jgi:serine protease AprX